MVFRKLSILLLTIVLVALGTFIVLSRREKEIKPPLKSEENTTEKVSTVTPSPQKPEKPKQEEPKEALEEKPKEQPKQEVPKQVEILPEINIGNTSKKQVIFTFDAGAGSQSAAKILEVLDKYKVKGTFFFTGRWAEVNKTLAKTIASKHEVFNHTYSHPDLKTISDQEIRGELHKGEEIISAIIGKSTKPYFRPPYGSRDTRVWKIASEEGYRSIYWTVDALDWKESQGFTAIQTKERILANVKPGAIYLMHMGDNITGEILEEVFLAIQTKGYTIVSLTQGI